MDEASDISKSNVACQPSEGYLCAVRGEIERLEYLILVISLAAEASEPERSHRKTFDGNIICICNVVVGLVCFSRDVLRMGKT